MEELNVGSVHVEVYPNGLTIYDKDRPGSTIHIPTDGISDIVAFLTHYSTHENVV